MLSNPTWRSNPTKEHPLYVCPGDLVQIGHGFQEQVISQHTGVLWLEDGEWAGDVLLAEPLPGAFDYIPPHARVINSMLHVVGLK